VDTRIYVVGTLPILSGVAMFLSLVIVNGCGENSGSGHSDEYAAQGVAGESASHEAESIHDGEQDHEAGHGTDGAAAAIPMSGEECRQYGIEVVVAGPGQLRVYRNLSGEIVIDPDRMSHVVPPISGIVHDIRKSVGDAVRKNEVMAVLNSRELSDIHSAFLVARERLKLAETTFRREEQLWKQEVSSEREYLDAKQNLHESSVEFESAKHKLLALGFDERRLDGLDFGAGRELTRYEITAPIDGVVIGRYITVGESLTGESKAFVIADLDTVWVQLNVYGKDLPYVRTGQKVEISTVDKSDSLSGVISYISPMVDSETRSATARVEIGNGGGRWKPGLFVTGAIDVDAVNVPLMIPRTAIQSLEGESVVFVDTGNGFASKPVMVGRTDAAFAEILSGLSTGERYVCKGCFELKAKLVTTGMNPHAGHGH